MKPPIITHKAGWSQSNVFGRCGCGGLRIYGVCQSCGMIHRCAWCKSVQVSTESRIGHKTAVYRYDMTVPDTMADRRKISDGACHVCLIKSEPVIASRMILRQHPVPLSIWELN